MGTNHSLEDKYTATTGSVFMSGTQALVRLPMAQMRRDSAQGLNTRSFVTGYRGSPLGGYDQQLALAGSHLEEHGVVFQPGVNEDLAATAIWGTQQVPLSADATCDGVVGYWYGKGPGVDRCGDVFKHGNAAGSSQHGGVLCIAGDDHTAKSSTLPHQSDHAFMAAIMPVLYPSSIHEFIDLGLFGIAMSRYSGCWVGYKVIADTVETSAVVNVGNEMRQFVLPADFDMPGDGLNLRWPDPPLVQDDRLQEYKAYAAMAFARANRIDEIVFDSPNARLGIMSTGKAYEDVRQALFELGLDDVAMRDIGIRIFKVRMPWPLEPHGVREFSEGLEEVLVIEERREILENQIKQQLFNWRADVRPRIIGKFDHEDRHVLPLSTALSISRVARAIAERVLKLDIDPSLKDKVRVRLEYLQGRKAMRDTHESAIDRQPWFCSGCPHNTSTRVPEGSKAMAGIGCHYMVTWMDRDTDTFTQMGGEGVPWTAIAPFTDEKHRFVNLGDGTYFHSGLLAVRAAKAAGVNITYRVLYNDAVAMTGGQTVDGELSPEIIAHQLHAEGVSPLVLVSDEPEHFRPSDFPRGVTIRHRDEYDAVMREIRELPGCNAIIYAQTCAAEKRRRRKRGLMDTPDRRVMINADVCEGCGDCSVQSNCLSVEPLETPFGRKRTINQSSCNLDFSCLKGFCPSFVEVQGGQPRKPERLAIANMPGADDLPVPSAPDLSNKVWNIAITGVGGTGVLTIGSLLGMAAHIDGKAAMLLDMAGLAQKGGAVMSYIRLADVPERITSPQIVYGGADLLIGADAVVAASRDGISLCDAERTHALLNTTTAPVAGFVSNRDINFRQQTVEAQIADNVRDTEHFHAFAQLALALAGDTIATNVIMLGYAWQQGLVPLSLDAIDQAIALNGVAIDANREAFLWGRRLATDAEGIKAEIARQTATEATSRTIDSIDALIEHRATHLEAYQNRKLATRYRGVVERVQSAVSQAGIDDTTADKIVQAVADNYARLLAYKDEYEVARLYSLPAFRDSVEASFSGDYTVKVHMAPPVLGGTDPNGRPLKRAFGPWMFRAMRALRHGKRLRGTAFDVFGRSDERRAERAWIGFFENDIDTVLASLGEHNAERAVDLLGVPSSIRGFGPVKAEAMQGAEQQRAKALEGFANPGAPSPLHADRKSDEQTVTFVKPMKVTLADDMRKTGSD